MKKDVSVTSILAFYDLPLNDREYEVATAIRDLDARGVPVSCENIGKHLGYTPNRVSGRLTELRKKGAIVYNGNTVSQFGKYQDCYKLVTRDQQSLI